METTRFILLITLGLVLVMIWQAWQEDYGIPNDAVTDSEKIIAEKDIVPVDIPVAPVVSEDSQSIEIAPPVLTNRQIIDGEVIHVKTDVFEIEINTPLVERFSA